MLSRIIPMRPIPIYTKRAVFNIIAFTSRLFNYVIVRYHHKHGVMSIIRY